MKLSKQTKQFLLDAYRSGDKALDIATSANKSGLTTPQGKAFTAHTALYWLRKSGIRQRTWTRRTVEKSTVTRGDTLADAVLEIMTTKLSERMKKKLISVLVSE